MGEPGNPDHGPQFSILLLIEAPLVSVNALMGTIALKLSDKLGWWPPYLFPTYVPL